MFDELLDDNIEQFDMNNTPSTPSKSYAYKSYPKKEEVIKEPYIPVAFFIDREFPQEVKDKFYKLISQFINKKYMVRVNGDDKEFNDRIKTLSDKYIEFHLPWKLFNDIDSKHYFSTLSSQEIAKKHFSGWDKIPNSVRAFLSRNVRLLMGTKLNSPSLCLITWSEDGAHTKAEVTQKTGKASFIIKVASYYGFPVINLARKEAIAILERNFQLNLTE